MRLLSNSINIRGVAFGVVVVCAFSTAAFGQTNSLKPQCRRDRKFSDL